MSDLNSIVNNWLVASLVYSVKTRWAKSFQRIRSQSMFQGIGSTCGRMSF